MTSEAHAPSGRVVALELVVRCRACDAVVPINRVAPSSVCHECGHTIALTDDTWALVLREAADGASALREGEERAAIVEAGSSTFRCVLKRTAAHCLACREPLPLGEAARLIAQGAVFCMACGGRIGVRRAPAIVPGLELVVGEEPERTVATAHETRTLPCGGCGAPLSLVGEERTLKCAYCTASSVVPDEIWRDLHPRREVRRWFLVFTPNDEVRVASATWSSVTDVCVDEANNLYCVGRLDERDAETAVWCVAPDMTLRWARRSLSGLPHDRARLFIAGQGRVAVWFPGGPVVAFLDAATGETRGTYPPHDSARRAFSMADCVELLADADGTLLALLHTPRQWGAGTELCTFVRSSAAGELAELWPGVPSPSAPEMGTEVPTFMDLPSKPCWIAGNPRLAIGWDGTLFVYGGNYGGLGWARIRRDGFVTLDKMGVAAETPVAVDRSGTIHLLRGGELVVLDRCLTPLWRLDAKDGPAGLAEEHCLAVAPGGEITLVGHGGRLRRLGPQGAVVFTSDASRGADQAGRGRDRGWAVR